MQPLYIAATDTIIRDPAHRYVHPTTGEVYGRTDYDDPAKLAEIGAIPLTETDAEHADTDVRDGEILVMAPDGQSATITRQWRAKTANEIAAEAKAQAEANLRATETPSVAMRKLEDLIDTLITKGVIAKADLPVKAQEWVDTRKAERAKLA